MAYTTINKSTDYFNTVTYTGNGSTQNITGVGFQPDWVWIKNRSIAANHRLSDVVRGVPNLLYLPSTEAAGDDGNAISSVGSDGFTVGSSTAVNGSGNSIVSWNWLSSNTTASNTDGSITSTVSANTTSGFSIVSYTGNGYAGATVGHGLGVAPKMIIAKVRSTSEDWTVYHASLGATKYLKLSSNGASETITSIFNDTEPTSSVFSLGTQNKINMNTQTFIAYCFAEKQGYSKFGSYTGNGNADGTFVYTGFKPAFVLIKKSSATENWLLLDNKRDIDNTVQNTLLANTSNSEFTGTDRVDFLSNGFKCKTATGGINDSGTFIFMAFAKAPLVGTNNVPCTAR